MSVLKEARKSKGVGFPSKLTQVVLVQLTEQLSHDTRYSYAFNKTWHTFVMVYIPME